MTSFIQRAFLVPMLLARFRRMHRTKAFISLTEAKSIGILADLRKAGNVPPIVQFAKAIHKHDRRCHLLFIIPDKRKEVNPFDYERHFPGMPVELICRDELTLFNTPEKDQIKPFIAKVFDIVIYLETEENFSLQSVLWQSQAKMFAGPEGFCKGVFDFEIGLKEQTDLPFLAENLLKYLQTIQNSKDFEPQSESYKLF